MKLTVCVVYSVLLFVAASCMTAAASAECFSSADLLNIRWIVSISISPDGRQVAYCVLEPPDTSRGERRSHGDIWVADSDGTSSPRQYTFGPARDESPRFSADGRWIAFLSDRSGTVQLYRMLLAGGEAERITDFEDDVSLFAWAPDGARFAVIAPDPVPAEVKEARGRGDDERIAGGDERSGRLWIVDASSGEGRMVTPDSIHVQTADWSPDGKRIAMVISGGPGSNEVIFHSRLEVLDVADGGMTILSDRAQGYPAWSRDGASIAFTYRLQHAEITVGVPFVAVVAAKGGPVNILGRNHDATLVNPVWLPGGNRLIVTECAGVTARLAYLSIADDKVDAFEDVFMPYYRWRGCDVSRDGSRVAILKGSVSSPPDLWSMERGLLGKRRQLTRVNAWLEGRDLPSARVVRWSSRDGTEIEGILMLPAGYSEARRYPAVINVHGGPMWAWWLGWHGSWHEWAVPLACRGFVVLLPNPRGSLGYGYGFARANFDDWGEGDFEDVMAGVDFLVEKGFADPRRIGIGGWSYGGYLSSWAITQTDRFAAAVVGAGVTNLFSFHGTTDITPAFLSSYFRETACRRPEAYRDRSAVNYVLRVKTPTLILHGEEDVRVPPGQAYELYNGLLQAGVPVQLVTYPREGHGFTEICHQIDLLERVIEWFETRLR